MFASAVPLGLNLGGLSLFGYGFLKFVQWLCEFVARRQNERADRLEKQDAELKARFDTRLRHVEGELDRYRQATMKLVTRMGTVLPHDPVLNEVANILRGTFKPADGEPDADLLEQLGKLP